MIWLINSTPSMIDTPKEAAGLPLSSFTLAFPLQMLNGFQSFDGCRVGILLPPTCFLREKGLFHL
ncbi:hypothetical protein ZIOFF_024739 [Zingiber officinale]|uniref:Uncharacterized protein n=1 Tax=Zingiber officinale TaxID=94328 RepID=A0A8J5H0T1_ZINOF|nr:hypothetical protein ZIOFF_024739 [Zingiber officinale]